MTHAAANPSNIRRRTVLLCAVLAAVLALLWLTPASLASWRRWNAPQPQPPALGEFERAALTPRTGAGVQEEALQRPLFLPARRPPAKASEETAPAAPEPIIWLAWREILPVGRKILYQWGIEPFQAHHNEL